MINSLLELQQAFSQLDVSRLEAAYQALEKNPLSALEFAKNPDEFMKSFFGSSFPSELHFHIELDGQEYPKDDTEIGVRLVLHFPLNLPVSAKAEIVAAANSATRILGPGHGPGGFCRGCKYCSIAVVNWVK